VTEIVIVTRADRLGEFEKAIGSVDKVSAIVAGGEHRYHSVAEGLRHINRSAEYIAVHDGARPLITPAQIQNVFEKAQVSGAASLAEPVRDTLKRANENLEVCDSIDRHQVYAMQTPQIFERKLLEQAYQLVANNNKRVTDEVSAVELLGRTIVLVPNPDANFKITYEHDLQLAEAVLLKRKKMA
jgi:2-C-methyl-D-erythritol 4-phosphate cytidylyltransferase